MGLQLMQEILFFLRVFVVSANKLMKCLKSFVNRLYILIDKLGLNDLDIVDRVNSAVHVHNILILKTPNNVSNGITLTDVCEELVAKPPDEWWAKKPAPDKWSVAEVVEHLSLVEPMLFGMAQQALAQPSDPNWARVAGQLTTEQQLGFLANRTQKFQAPEPAQPKGSLSRAEALSRFAGARQVTTEYVRRTSDAVDEHVAALPMGQMTVHQLLTMIGGHNLRHNAQIAEVLAALQKP